jgi:hypothetical protein
MGSGPGIAGRYVLAYLRAAAKHWELQHLVADIAAARAAGIDAGEAFRATGLARPSRSDYETVRRAAHKLERRGLVLLTCGERLRCMLSTFGSAEGELRYAQRHAAELARNLSLMRPKDQVALIRLLAGHDENWRRLRDGPNRRGVGAVRGV